MTARGMSVFGSEPISAPGVKRRRDVATNLPICFDFYFWGTNPLRT